MGVAHYQDPKTKMVACAGLVGADLMTSMREHVTCEACLSLPDWQEEVRREKVLAALAAPRGCVESAGDDVIHFGWRGSDVTACGKRESETSAGTYVLGEETCPACKRAMLDPHGLFKEAVHYSQDLQRPPPYGAEPTGSCVTSMGEDVTCGACKEALLDARLTGALQKERAELEARRDLFCAQRALLEKNVGLRVSADNADAVWLRERGEDAASLRALVEAVDAAVETWGGDPSKLDSRAKVVDRLSTEFHRGNAEICKLTDQIEALELRVAELEDTGDPGPDDAEDVPLGGLSHEDAHFVLSGVRTAADALDAACVGGAWPDEARKWARHLRELLK